MINERKLAWKYLCKNKKRSRNTLIAISLAVFLVFASGNLALSFYEDSRTQFLRESGNHIACLEGIKTKDLSDLEQDGAVICALENTRYYTGELGLKGRESTFEFYSFEDFEHFPFYYKIIQGRTPKESGEIMLHADWKYYLGENGDIGDTITLQLSEKETGKEATGEEKIVTKTYTLAGYYQCTEYSVLNQPIVLVKDEPRDLEKSYLVYITSEKEGIENLYSLKGFKEKEEWARRLGETYGAKVEVNSIFTSMDLKEADLTYCLILLMSMMIGGFAAIVIRNAFLISVVERTRDYGMLRCIGASKRQIRNIACYEAAILGGAGEVLGIGIAYLFLGIGIKIGKQYSIFSETFQLVHKPMLIAGLCFSLFGVVLFGLLEPVRQINILHPLNALRNLNNLKKEHYLVPKKRGRIKRNLFGVEAAYAYKNIMRNRKRFFTTTLTCIASIAFFVGINASLDYTEQTFEEGTLDEHHYNARLFVNESVLDSVDLVIEELKGIEGVNRVMYRYYDVLQVENESLMKKGNGSSVELVKIIAIDENQLEISEETVEKGQIGNLEPQECYVVNWGTIERLEVRREISEVLPGSQIELGVYEMEKEASVDKNTATLEVKAVLTEQPYEDTDGTTPVMIVSKEGFKALAEKLDVSYKERAQIFLNMGEACNTEEVRAFAIKHGMMFYDEMKNYRDWVDELNMVKFIGNLFLILVALISSMSLFNSMEANFTLREQERKILRTVGMSLRQYRKMILIESGLALLISFVVGTVLGVGFGYGIYKIMSMTDTQLRVVVPVGSIVLAGIVMVLLTVLSSLGEMKKE